MATCFVIYNSDGDTFVRRTDTETLEKELSSGHYGDNPHFLETPDNDTNYWGDGYLIIVGDVVVPKAIETITKYRITP